MKPTLPFSGLNLALAAALAAPFPLASGAGESAHDWPRWRGPGLDGVSAERIPLEYPDEIPVLWRARVGTGFSAVSVARGRVFTMGNEEDEDIVWCLDAATGEVIWEHRYPCPLDPLYFEGGPCATPTVEGDAVYTFSRKGHAFRLDFTTGAVAWERNLLDDLGLELPEWSFASSPYLHGDLVVFNAGDSGVALRRDTGEIAWHSPPRTAGYATPVPWPEERNASLLLLFGAREFMGLAPDTGEVAWRLPWETGREVNAADPIVSGRRVHVSSADGSAVFELGEDLRAAPREVWRNQDLRCYFNAPVLSGGHLYAIHGTTHRPTSLVCLDWETGETRWSEPGFGSGAVTAAGDLGILLDQGQLTIFRLQPDGYEPLLQQQVLGGKCWTVPVLSGGVIYCRNAEGDLVAARLADPS